jgi:hypothetical protein
VFYGQAVASQDVDTTSVVLTFQVPKSAAVGTHVVRAVGDTFTCFCNPDGKFTVLSAGGSSLARTGVEAGLLVAVAVALLLFGRGLVMASRRGRGAEAAEDELDEELTLANSGR